MIEQLEQATISKPDLLEEFADMFFMWVQALELAGFDRSDVRLAIRSKLAKNMLRSWAKPDEHGVIRHTAEGAQA